jgi:hypothetical protein
MKNTVRASRKSGIKTVSFQPKTPVSAAGTGETPALQNVPLVPSDVALRVLDELALMESTGKAAAALLVMEAAQAKSDSESASGWESLAVPGFGDGVVTLAHLIIEDFQSQLADTAGAVRAMAEQIREIDSPVTPLFGAGNSEAVKSHYTSDLWELEMAVASLRHLVSLVGIICSDRACENHQVAHETAFALYRRLGERHLALWAAQVDLHSVFAALAVVAKKPASAV